MRCRNGQRQNDIICAWHEIGRDTTATIYNRTRSIIQYVHCRKTLSVNLTFEPITLKMSAVICGPDNEICPRILEAGETRSSATAQSVWIVLINRGEYRHKSRIAESTFFRLHFCRRQYGTFFNYFYVTGYQSCQIWPLRCSRAFLVTDFGTN